MHVVCHEISPAVSCSSCSFCDAVDVKTCDVLFHVWEMAVSFLGLPPLALLRQEHTNRRRAAQRRTTREYTTQIQKVSAQIEASQLSWQQIKRFRNRLSAMRGKLQTRQRELSLARENWCRAVTALGLDETVEPETAFRQYQTAWDLIDRRRRWNVAMDNAVTLPGYKYYLDAREPAEALPALVEKVAASRA